MKEELLKLAIKKGYTKKWISYSYCLMDSPNCYIVTGEYDTKKEADRNSFGGMNYTMYSSERNPNYNK